MARKYRSALLLGLFTTAATSPENYFTFTENSKILDLHLKGALKKHMISDGPFTNGNKIKMFHFDDPTTYYFVRNYHRIAVVDLGPLNVPIGLEHSNIKIDNIIDSIVTALRYLKENHFDEIHIDGCGHPKIIGTAVTLMLPCLNSLSNVDEMTVKFFDDFNLGGESEYNEGIFLGKGQIIAQKLMKSASVSEFVKNTKSFLEEFDVEITERDSLWMKSNNMDALLSVAKDANERPVILELSLNNLPEPSKPLIIVGKATPFESTLFPLNDKPEFHKFRFRSGMGGASSIIGSFYTLCKLRAPVQVRCIVAIVSNQMYDKTSKKGAVVRAMNGTSIQIDRPEAEGRLVIADLLCYADTLDSSAIIDISTLSSNIESLLGNSYIGFFTSDENLKRILQGASLSSGEKIWQLPLYNYFRSLLKTSEAADTISNVGLDEKSACTCKSASFLQEFLSSSRPWIHLDISAVTESRGKKKYLNDWATGRSTRLLTEFCRNFFKQN